MDSYFYLCVVKENASSRRNLNKRSASDESESDEESEEGEWSWKQASLINPLARDCSTYSSRCPPWLCLVYKSDRLGLTCRSLILWNVSCTLKKICFLLRDIMPILAGAHTYLFLCFWFWWNGRKILCKTYHIFIFWFWFLQSLNKML